MPQQRTQMGLRRGLTVVETLARHGGQSSFSQLQAALGGLASTTLARLLKTLQEEGWVEKDTASRTYRIAGRTLGLASTIEGVLPTEALLRPVLRDLSRASGQTAAYCEDDGNAYTIVAKEEHENSAHMAAEGTPNQRYTRHGFGMLCLAHADEQRRARACAQEPPADGNEGAFLLRLDRAVEEGFLVEHGEANPRWTRAVAPVFSRGTFLGAIGLQMPRCDLLGADYDHIKDLVTSAAGKATDLLKHRKE